MRKYTWLAGLTLGLMGAGSADAQTIKVMPTFTNNSPMDYRTINAPIGGATYQTNTTGTAFPYTLASMFYQPGRLNTFNNTITNGQSTYPTPVQMQAASPSYFSSFQMYRAGFISP